MISFLRNLARPNPLFRTAWGFVPRFAFLLAVCAAQPFQPCIAAFRAVERHVPNRNDVWEQLRLRDLRLASLIYRLSVANVGLCGNQMAETGLVLQSIDEFKPAIRQDAKRAFGFYATLSVEAVVPGSPSDLSGVHQNDGIYKVNSQIIGEDNLTLKSSTAMRDLTQSFIEALPLAQPINFMLIDGSHRFPISLRPVPGCLVRAELVTTDSYLAQSDDQIIQIGAPFFDRFDDNSLVVVVAHEMAHLILKHGSRLEAAGIHRGLLSEFGKSSRLVREAEDQADRFSIRLLKNAGFDPEIGPKFWRGPGRALDAGWFRGATHSAPAERAANMDDEIRKLTNEPAGAPFEGPMH